MTYIEILITESWDLITWKTQPSPVPPEGSHHLCLFVCLFFVCDNNNSLKLLASVNGFSCAHN